MLITALLLTRSSGMMAAAAKMDGVDIPDAGNGIETLNWSK